MVTIKRLDKKDAALFSRLIAMFNEVFEEKKTKGASAAYVTKLLSNPGFIAITAMDGNKVVGGITAYELPQYGGEHSEILLYDMAVHTNYQRKGIGKKLISFLTQYCKKEKIPLFFVEAHEQDKHAVSFYKSAGGKAEKVVHFNYKIR
jgi:aminoglycoside 3-N-acetyltransferase I